MAQRVGGIIRVKVDGVELRAKGDFTWNTGAPKRDAVIGAGSVHGYKEAPQVAFIEGVVTDGQDLDVDALTQGTDLTVLLELANGKSVVLRQAWFAGDAEGNTGEGEIKVRWESASKADFV